MKGGAWAHRRSYISRWIYQLTSLSERTLAMSKPRINEDAFVSALQEGDELGNAMESSGAVMPSMERINRDLASLTPTAGQEEEGREMNDEELEEMLDEKTPVLPNQEFPRPSKIPPVIIDEQEEKEEESMNYAESFASQRETSQLREELEAMSEEMKELKLTIAGVLKEREALPSHLSAIREDINRQMTLMLEKLHSAAEADISSSGVNAMATTLESVKESSTERLAAAADYATDRPRQNSPLATPGAELKGKRRFRPVK